MSNKSIVKIFFTIGIFIGLVGSIIGLSLGIIFSAAYMLYLYRRIIFGELTNDKLKKVFDLTPREWSLFVPLVLLTIWMGIYPSTFLEFMHVSVDSLLKQIEQAEAIATNISFAAK